MEPVLGKMVPVGEELPKFSSAKSEGRLAPVSLTDQEFMLFSTIGIPIWQWWPESKKGFFPQM